MRISDWSSDVCSSDLEIGHPGGKQYGTANCVATEQGALGALQNLDVFQIECWHVDALGRQRDFGDISYRSEERRVGKECGSTGRSRWSPYNKKKRRIKRSNPEEIPNIKRIKKK